MKTLIAKYVNMQSKMQAMLKDEKGATMVEYGLMLALIAAVCITAVTAIGDGANTTFEAVVAAL